MANIKISDLPDAALPLDGPNSFFEVQTIEAGIDVSRKVASDQLTLAAAIIIEDEGVPLVTGAETLDFVGAGVVASGVGTTKTITISGGGQVDSVVSGVNITIDATDPVNPIANLNAAITGVSVNGVTLSDAGVATNYLDETGAYSLPPGSGQVDSVGGGININVTGTAVDPIVNLDAAITGVSVNAVTLTAAGAATNFLNETGAYSVPPSGGIGGSIADNQVAVGAAIANDIEGSADFTWDGNFFSIANASGILVRDGGFLRLANPLDSAFMTLAVDAVPDALTSFTGVSLWRIADGIEMRIEAVAMTDWMSMQHDGDFMNFSFALSEGLKLNDVPLYFESRASAGVDETGYGQIWVETGVAGDPLWAEVELLADMDGPDAATSYTEISVNAAVATFNGNAQLDTAQFESGTASLLLDGTGDWITFPDIAAYDLGTQSWTIEGFVRFNTLPPLQTSAGPGYVLYDSRKGGSALVQYGIIQDAFGFRVRLVGQDWGAEVGTISGGISINTWYHWAVTRDVGGDGNVRAYFNGLYEVADFGVSPADLGNPDAPIIIGCRDASDAFHDGWIDDVRVTIGTARYSGTGAYTPPTTPYLGAPIPVDLFFTDDIGVDFQLNGGGGAAQTPWLSDIDGDGFDLNDMGVIFMREQAASEPDVPTQGQIWIRDDSFANTLMFTTGQGNEFEVGGLPYNGDVLNGSLSLTGTTFGGAANIGPKPDHFYMIIARGQITTPDATDDGKVQLTVDTLSLFQGLYTDSNGQSVSMQSATGEVVTNTVVVDTDGSGVDDGTYFQIIGTLRSGASAQTVSLRVAKNANNGGNGLCSFPSISVIQLTE